MPTTTPEHDQAGAWDSELWGDPSTRVAPWETSAPPPAPPAPEPLLRHDRGRRSPWLIAGAAALAVLVGFGATRAFAPASDADPVAEQAPTPPAASSPQPSDPAPQDPGAQDPSGAGELPNLGQIPGIGSLPGLGDPQAGSSQSRTLSDVAAKVAPSIVDITATNSYSGSGGAGTGEILTEDGYVITNHHVIEGSTSLEVTVAMTGATYSADVVGYDATHDIAVIKLRGASGLVPAPFGDSSTVRIGDAVVGLGNAGGVGGTPIEAAGTVTGLDRSITATDAANGTAEQLSGLIETDADIQPGDSGGSLIDADGKVIGIITAGSRSTGRDGGTDTDGYAVPVNQALAIADDIRAGRASSTVHIGATAFLGIQVSTSSSTVSGVAVSGVTSGSAAEKAGITAGSTITAVDGARVTSRESLKAALSAKKPGDVVRVSWVDGSGAKRSADVTLGSGPVG